MIVKLTFKKVSNIVDIILSVVFILSCIILIILPYSTASNDIRIASLPFQLSWDMNYDYRTTIRDVGLWWVWWVTLPADMIYIALLEFTFIADFFELSNLTVKNAVVGMSSLFYFLYCFWALVVGDDEDSGMPPWYIPGLLPTILAYLSVYI